MLKVFVTLLICSATMSAIALFYMAITPLLAKRYSAKWRYYAWLVIVIGLLIPFRPHFTTAIVTVDVPTETTPITQTWNGTPNNAMPNEDIAPSALASSSISWEQIAMEIWLAGVISVFSYHAIRHYRFTRMVKRWSQEVTDTRSLGILHELNEQMGVPCVVNLQECSCVPAPMMIGFCSPTILLPKANFSDDELGFILKHELVHWGRKDLWYKSLVLATTAIHWFNPIVYLMSKEISAQCELSCDEEVLRSENTDIRQHYCETIIGMIRNQYKVKTALSTNFYGGKKGMKKRIFFIMDTSKRKAGVAVICIALIATIGTGFAFAANAEPQSSPEYIKEDIKEDIVVSPTFSYAYKFLPDPEIYAKYLSYGITISDDGEVLHYNGQRVRLFVDKHSDVEAFFLDEAGTIDLAVIRNASGDITGIERISEDKAQEYRSAFFADDINATTNTQDTTGKNKYEQYSAYGIALSADGDVLNYNGQRVKLLVDMLSDGSFETYWFDEAGTANLSVVRNSTGQITAIESISDEQAQEYNSAADEYEQNALNGLDEKIEERMRERIPE